MTSIPVRREPPRFRAVRVLGVRQRGPRLVRISLGGPELTGFEPPLPAASVRLLLPDPATGELAIPTWNGNEFLAADGARPLLRTLTPLGFDPARSALDVEIVLHDHGPLAAWAQRAAPGDPVAISGPGRGHELDDAAPALLLGDESAIPAISTLLATAPAHAELTVVIEIAAPDGEVTLPGAADHPVSWIVAQPGEPPGSRLVIALEGADLTPGTQIWAAGEAAAMQRLRTIVKERGLNRSDVVIRGYWKVDRASRSE